MSKSKHTKVQTLQNSSPDQQLIYFKNRTREKLHLLKSKIMQYQENHYSVHSRRNLTLHEITQRYVDAISKKSRNDNLSNNKNPQYFRQTHSRKDIGDKSSEFDIEQLSDEQKIYIDNPVLHYDPFSDEGKKWKVSWNCEINFMDFDLEEILGMLMMFESGFFPFICGKKQTKSKVYVQHLDKLKKRPSRKIETFKSPIAGGYWMVFSWAIERLNMQKYVMCVCLNSISKEVSTNKADYAIDTMFEQTKFAISPGETNYSSFNQKQQKNIHYFKFGDNISHFSSTEHGINKILPTKLSPELINNSLSSFTDPILATSSSLAFHQIELTKDNTNYDCVRYIYKELSDKECFSYSLSPSQYDVLEQKGNLIVIGRSGTGKTTCALLRMFFKQLNNTNKNQKNVFLTASPILIAEIAKKFNQLKDGIKQLHDYDYFNKSFTTTNTISITQKFVARLDETNQKLSQVKRNHFLQSKYFPYFLTIREYIENLDASMNKPFFSTKEENQNDNDEKKQQGTVQYPDEIAWQMRIIRTRNFQCDEKQQTLQQWAEIDYFHFQSKIYTLPEFKHASKTLSSEMVWSEIFSTIKGSSRAHSFFHKFLNFDTYCKQSKNQFLSLEQKKKVYELFLLYEKHKQATKQYDLLDVVNHIISQLKIRKQNQDIALTSLFIDEIQDLPPAFVFLTGKIVQESVFFCGDTAQTIAKGVNFSFSAVREQFQPRYYENNLKLQKPQIKHLNVNFRSHNEIIQLSNSLIRCLEIMFPQSIDRMPMQISPNSGMKPLIIKPHDIWSIVEQFKHSSSSNDLNQKKILFGADKAIIVRMQSDKALIPEELSKMTCLTYQECKGLEYNVVILYNFFSSCPDIQWAFLKHIELSTNQKGQKNLSFNKNKLGSNIRMYFDLCSELKILYTVATRPRSVLIICDQKVPDQLMRIWSFLNLVRQDERSRQYGRYTSNSTSKYQGRKQTKNLDRKEEEKIIQFQKVSDDKFYKEWVQEGFKMFFERKLYQQAQKCFENIKLNQLANISHAFALANSACYDENDQEESTKKYQQAAELFYQQGRSFEAGKCYYQAKNYSQALRNFRTLNIRKYMAACLWKMGQFFEAEKIFFQQQKFQKGLQVMVQSRYWAWFFSRLCNYSAYLVQCKTSLIKSGIKQGAQSLISTFSLYLIENNTLEKSSEFYSILEQSLSSCKNYGVTESSKIKYFMDLHQKFVKLQGQKSQQEGSLQNLGQSNKFGVIWTALFNGMSSKKKDSVVIAFLIMISYIEQKYAQYYNMKKYRKYKSLSISRQNQNNKILQTPLLGQQSQLLNKFLNIILKAILNFLETFKQFEFIAYLTKILNQYDIKLLVILENLLQINQNVKNQQLERENMVKRVNLHYRMLKHVDDKKTADKLTVFLMLFGAIKGVELSLKNQIPVMKWYLECSDNLFEKKISLRLDHCKNYHNIYSFTQHPEQKLNQIMPFTAHPYCVIFKFVDQSSTISYFPTNQKEKLFENQYSRLTKQEQRELERKIQQQVSEVFKDSINKINAKNSLLKKKQEQKIKKFIETSNQQIQANNQQRHIAKSIQKYLWLPQECKNTNKQHNSLKKDCRQIERQLEYNLKKIESTKKEFVKSFENKLKKLKQLQEREKSCKQMQKQKTGTMILKIQKIEAEYQKAFEYKENLRQQINRYEEQNKKTNNMQESSFGMKISNWFTDRKIDYSQSKLKSANSQLQKIKTSKISAMEQFDKVQAQIYMIRNIILKDLADLDQESYRNFMSKGNDKLDLSYLIQQTIQPMKKFINEKIKETCQLHDKQARQVYKQYKKILQNVKNYMYYRQTVPNTCIQKRQSLTNQIKVIKQELQLIQTPQKQARLKIQTRMEIQFKKMAYKKHVREGRKKYLKEKILNVKDDSKVKTTINNQLLQVIELITRLEIKENQPITIQAGQREKTSRLLEKILKTKEQSLAKQWILLYFLLHNEEIPLLEKSIVEGTHKKFCNQLKNFVDKILKANESEMIMRNVLAVFGVNVIDAANGDELRFLYGFAFVEKTHILYSELRRLFSHNISHTHILCQTKETVIVFQTYLLNHIEKSDILRRIFNVKLTLTKKVDQLNYRNEEQLIQTEMKIVSWVRQWHAIIETSKQVDLKREEIFLIKEKLSDIKKVLFSQLIMLQQSLQINNEIRSQKMSTLLARVNIVSSFTDSLDQLGQILIRYTQQQKWRESDLLKQNENTKQYDSNGSQINTIEDARRSFINSMKKRENEQKQVPQQTFVYSNSWNTGIVTSKIDKQQVIKTVGKTRKVIEQKTIQPVYFREQEYEYDYEQEESEDSQYQYDSQQDSKNKVYYDIYKKKWVGNR